MRRPYGAIESLEDLPPSDHVRGRLYPPPSPFDLSILRQAQDTAGSGSGGRELPIPYDA